MIEFNGSPLLDGQVAVVTGAGQGMGREIAIGLAAAGAKVVVADVNMQTTEETGALIEQQGGTAWSVRWDVSDPDQARLAASRVHELAGDVSILVNNAGIHRRGQFGEEGHFGTWREVMAVNLDGMMYGITAFLDQLKRTKGNIINLASIQSFTAAPNFTTAYAASKGGVAMLTKSLAADLAQHGVRVNAIAPGFIETPQTAVSRANPDRVAFVMSHTPMKRAGRAGEMAGPAVFLASHLASFVTGVILPVDGGFLTL
ncbi:SDR family oxidoreductase [Variovorax sp. J31P207]|uniref:SDR family NAD(P)-dependent oxidoreductase n=1 Tax=Variovorax sp. J31P207 TaxID=3053510 RepID=UPI00257881CB|nr:SDR family oxidoreductase [Variovorax sp. J31P207]MDM0065248.1 SDR family oxidoreductase [Variovorax sp. J31P207]